MILESMAALMEVILALIAFVAEMTIYTVVLLYLAVRSISNQKYRHQLHEKWSGARKVGFAIYVASLGVVLAFCLHFWNSLMMAGGKEEKVAEQVEEPSPISKAIQHVDAFLEWKSNKKQQ